LTGDEAHHVVVQRLRAGDAIALFDGQGGLARGIVATISRHEVRITVQEHARAPVPEPRLALYSAVPKGDRIHVLLDMATQLGVSSFTPVRWHRSVVEPSARAQERWRRICVEACKQSRRLHVPAITAALSLEEAADHARAAGEQLLVAHRSENAAPVLSLDVSNARCLALFVGPEGGITEEEARVLMGFGAAFVHLGDATLRVETAAVTLLALAYARLRTQKLKPA
jgi:16S rRNA (uracil1498-N3)-methyltransferase